MQIFSSQIISINEQRTLERNQQNSEAKKDFSKNSNDRRSSKHWKVKPKSNYCMLRVMNVNTRTFSKLLLVYSFGITMNSEGLRSDKRFHCRESVALSRFWKRANIMSKLSRSIKAKF